MFDPISDCIDCDRPIEHDSMADNTRCGDCARDKLHGFRADKDEPDICADCGHDEHWHSEL